MDNRVVILIEALKGLGYEREASIIEEVNSESNTFGLAKFNPPHRDKYFNWHAARVLMEHNWARINYFLEGSNRQRVEWSNLYDALLRVEEAREWGSVVIF